MRTFLEKPKATRTAASSTAMPARQPDPAPTQTLQAAHSPASSAIPGRFPNSAPAPNTAPTTEPEAHYEQQADRVADAVVRMSLAPEPGVLPRRPALTEVQPGSAVQGRPQARSQKAGQTTVPESSGLQGATGQALTPAERAYFEPRFGWDFSNVRIHSGRRAAASAAGFNARAYTYGSHVVFGVGEYAPGTRSGRNLIAHELAHVVQQHSGAPRRFARKPVTRYGTDTAIDSDRSDIESALKGSYWEQLVFARYAATYMSPVSSRFKKDAEERDAVLSALWQAKPAKLKSKLKRSVVIPARGPKTKPVLYDFTFEPKAKGEELDKVLIEFKAEGKKADIIEAPKPEAGYTPSALSAGSSGFPEPISDYWKKHPDEQTQVYHWVEKLAGDSFDQKLIARTTLKKKKRNVLFRVEGSKTSDKVTKLEVTFIGDQAPQTASPPAGYDNKDMIDLQLEKAQALKKNGLGAISGLTSIPADEVTSVKHTIWQYFDGKNQNTEIDVIIPIANKTTRVFYTLRFQQKDKKSKKIDVEVARVGEEKPNTTMDKDQLSIRRVHGFADNSADVASLKAWLAKRYPQITPSGSSVDDMVTAADKDMQAKAQSNTWFKGNYDIHILSAADGTTRLQSIHKYDPLQTVNMKAFTTKELHFLEFSLQTMSDALLAKLKTIRMTRQEVKQDKKKHVVVPDTKTGGLTLTAGSDKTIIIFDKGIHTGDLLFIGGTQGVRPKSTQLFTHELGHVVQWQDDIGKKFNAFVAKKKIKPVTNYAASKKHKEFFPEAFALYQNDPEWMKSNLPELYAWFETLSTTGKPP